MTYVLRLAFKNTFRKPGRSLSTACSVVVGVAMTIFAWAFVDGTDRSVIDGQVRSDTGHFRIMAEGYLETAEEGELRGLIEPVEAVQRLVQDQVPNVRLHPRLSFAAELSDGRHGLPARGVGIEPERYFRDFTLPLERRLHADPKGLSPLWIGAQLASSLGSRPGDTLTVLARTRRGSYTAEEFVVSGLVRSNNPAIDNIAFFIPLKVAQSLLDSEGAVTELVGFLPRQGLATDLAARLRPELVPRRLRLQTWLERAEPLLRINRVRRRIFALVIGIVMLIAASSIANTVLMSCFERIQEIGTLRALGFETERVVALLLAEALVIGLLGAALGAAAGAALVHSWRDGFDFSRFAANGSSALSLTAVLYFVLDWGHVAVAFLIGLVTSAAAACYPALKFSRLSPAEAMRR